MHTFLLYSLAFIISIMAIVTMCRAFLHKDSRIFRHAVYYTITAIALLAYETRIQSIETATNTPAGFISETAFQRDTLLFSCSSLIILILALIIDKTKFKSRKAHNWATAGIITLTIYAFVMSFHFASFYKQHENQTPSIAGITEHVFTPSNTTVPQTFTISHYEEDK